MVETDREQGSRMAAPVPVPAIRAAPRLPGVSACSVVTVLEQGQTIGVAEFVLARVLCLQFGTPVPAARV